MIYDLEATERVTIKQDIQIKITSELGVQFLELENFIEPGDVPVIIQGKLLFSMKHCLSNLIKLAKLTGYVYKIEKSEVRVSSVQDIKEVLKLWT